MEAVMKMVLFALLFLPAVANAIVGPAGGISSGQATTLGDARYLKLDTSNDPLTGELAGTSSVFSSSMTAAQIVLTKALSGITWADGSVSTTAPAGAAAISGLTAGAIPKASAANALANSVIFEATGNIGIGTTAPGKQLDVSNASSTTIRITNTENDSSWFDGKYYGGLEFYGSDASFIGPGVKGAIRVYEQFGGTTGGPGLLGFYTSGSGNDQKSMTLMQTGTGEHRLGIGQTGTNYPLYPLDVVGGARVSGQSIVDGTMTVSGNAFSVGTSTFVVTGGKVGIGVASPAQKLEIDHGANNFGFRVGYGSAGPQYTMDLGRNNGTGDFYFNSNTASSGIGFSIVGSTKIYIGASGTVGINTATPDTSAKLNVAGNISTTGQVISSGTGSNYLGGDLVMGKNTAMIDFIGATTSPTGTMRANRGMSFQVGSASYDFNFQHTYAAPVNLLTVKGSGNVGISSAAPTALLTVQANSSVGPEGYTLLVSSQNATRVFGIHGSGNWSVSGASVSLGTCANGALTAGSSSTLGEVTFSGTNSTCAIVFGAAFDSTPICFLTTHSAGLVGTEVSAESTAGFTFVPRAGNFGLGDAVHYFCPGMH